jgi:predicted Zn finger-like uncharacterized protein
MVAVCPRCRTKLKVDKTKLSPEGSRFRCPSCATVLGVKKPAALVKKTLDSGKVLVAHSNSDILTKASFLLKDNGYHVITASDGIDAMVKTLREYPFLSLMEAALPKIHGFEVCKRLKSREETKRMKFILIASAYDKTKYRREPAALYGADDYVEEHDIPAGLLDKIKRLQGLPEEETEKAAGPTPEKSELPEPEYGKDPDVKVEAPPVESGVPDEKIEKARRLGRTIINDIYLYNSAKVDESIRNNNFYSVFATEVREGQKLYESRIPQEIRKQSDFYREAIDNFISKKKEALC